MTYEEYLEHIRTHPMKMARLRHFDLERWSCAFFTYSNETYKPCLLRSDEWFGTMEAHEVTTVVPPGGRL
jgi:hypothetical protein